MKKIALFLLLITLILTGCGGGEAFSSVKSAQISTSDNTAPKESNSHQNPSGNNSNNKKDSSGSKNTQNGNQSKKKIIDPDTQTISVFYRAIADGKINGWDGAKNAKDYYLVLTNYLRSLPIKCHDSKGYEGPVKALKWSDRLEEAAKEHSDDMLANNFFDHYGSDGSSPIDRIKDNGFIGRGYGENIAYQKNNGIPYTGYEWLIAFVKWIQSRSGHCSNIMNPDFEYVGMAQSKSENGRKVTLYWTQDFGVK